MPGSEQTQSQSNVLLHRIISNVLPINPLAPGKRHLEINRACPQIWVQNVSDNEEVINNELQTEAPAKPDEPLVHQQKAELVLKIAQWLNAIQTHGFSPGILQKYLNPEVNEDEEDDTWWQPDLVRVFLPYYDIEKEDIEQVVEGKTNRLGDPVGRCTVRLVNGDEITGTFRGERTLSGIASASGSNMEKHGLVSIRGFHRNGVLHGQGQAQLCARSLWAHIDRPVILEGIFNDGYLEGPVRGLDETGNLIFVGSFSKGVPSGACWLVKEGQGWIYGHVDAQGNFTGENLCYLYPDLLTAIAGSFQDAKLVEARAVVVESAQIDDQTDIMHLHLSTPEPDSPAFTFCPSTSKTIPCDWQLPDNYESVTVYSKKSNLEGAGDGLFAYRDLPPDTIVSYYNGLHIEPWEDYSPSSYNYQIYVDWKNTEGSAYVDIPMECIDLSGYSASLAHKANHSFSPNCKFISVDHPRFGRIPALKTIAAISRDAELFVHYKYDTAYAPTWYQEAWQRASHEDPSS